MAALMLTKERVDSIQQGYWLVRESDKQRYFIGREISVPALERVCEVVLGEKHGWDYWIDYCYGRDTAGRAAWANVDLTDFFF